MAKTGSKAVAPPSSTENRSREMAPNNTGRVRIKRKPSRAELHEAGWRGFPAAGTGMPATPRAASSNIPAATA